MRVLIVANGKIEEGRFSHFVNEQIKALQAEGVEIVCFGITSKGLLGYMKCARKLIKKIKETKPDIIHAHYGLTGLCANLQRKVPVVTTYHGSDIHSKGWRLALSKLSVKLSAHNIFVSIKLLEISGAKPSKSSIIPCGIDMATMQSIPRGDAKNLLKRTSPFVLFSGSFSNEIKNPSLAKESVAKIPELELVELDGYSRYETNLLINAADCFLLTSHREGSPQVIKEAMACGTPIVSVDVGDVKDVIGGTKGCFLAEYNADDIANKIREALAFGQKTDGRKRIVELGFDNNLIARKIISIYRAVL